MSFPRIALRAALATASLMLVVSQAAVAGEPFAGMAELCGIDGAKPKTYSVGLVDRSAPGGVLWPGDAAWFTFQFVNTTSAPIDYEYALNPVAPRYGGGTEIWRLAAPGVPRKHFFPRQPKAPVDGGPVADGKLAITRGGNTRVVETAIPWPEIPDVKRCLDDGRPIRFTFRVNDNAGPGYELAGGRSVSKVDTYTLHPYWSPHWSNEVEFVFEK
jgi:hypothetical protein